MNSSAFPASSATNLNKNCIDLDSDIEKAKLQAKVICKMSPTKRTYANISDSVRGKLIDMVINKEMHIKQASEALNIKYSSAKSIIQIYRREGRIGKIVPKRKYDQRDLIQLKCEGAESIGSDAESRVLQGNSHVFESTYQERVHLVKTYSSTGCQGYLGVADEKVEIETPLEGQSALANELYYDSEANRGSSGLPSTEQGSFDQYYSFGEEDTCKGSGNVIDDSSYTVSGHNSGDNNSFLTSQYSEVSEPVKTNFDDQTSSQTNLQGSGDMMNCAAVYQVPIQPMQNTNMVVYPGGNYVNQDAPLNYMPIYIIPQMMNFPNPINNIDNNSAQDQSKESPNQDINQNFGWNNGQFNGVYPPQYMPFQPQIIYIVRQQPIESQNSSS